MITVCWISKNKNKCKLISKATLKKVSGFWSPRVRRLRSARRHFYLFLFSVPMKRCPTDESQDDEINIDLQIWNRGSLSQCLKHSEIFGRPPSTITQRKCSKFRKVETNIILYAGSIGIILCSVLNDLFIYIQGVPKNVPILKMLKKFKQNLTNFFSFQKA